MKNLFALLMFVAFVGTAAAYEVCGPSVPSTDTAYTPVASIGDGGIYIGYWAVGSGCGGDSDADDIASMCTSVVAGGTAFCGADYWGAYTNGNLDEATASNGSGCWCRRTKATVNGALADSIGQAILIADVNDSTAECRSNCARLCAESVATNDSGMRHAIMVLPAF